MRIPTDRIAGAPITWGVCEVPGWGHQLPPGRVLSEMAALGLTATELGPDGFLPDEPGGIRAVLDRHGLELVAGFVPVVLHREGILGEQLTVVERRAASLSGAGADVLVLAADSEAAGYEDRPALTDGQWEVLLSALDRAEALVSGHGLEVVLHPHYGTVVEGPGEVDRVLADSSIGLCIDTGHLLVGGADPVEVTRVAADRVRHVHLKDVDAGLAARVAAGQVGYRQAVTDGLYRVLGDGDVDVTAIIRLLEGAGYQGWYVLEQDVVLEKAPDPGSGPSRDAAASLAYLHRLPDAGPAP